VDVNITDGGSMRLPFAALTVLAMLPLGGCVLVFHVEKPAGGSSISLAQGAATVSVPLLVDASNSIATVTGEITATGGGMTPITLVRGGASPRYQNSVEWTGSVPLAAGSYTFAATGTASSGSSPKTSRDNVTFTITPFAAQAAITLTLTPTGDLLVPRGGTSPILSFALTRANSTNAITLDASGLPNGVSMPSLSVPASAATSASLSATLTATPTANGQTTATFTARMTGATDADQTRIVRVVPQPGAFVWRPAPFLGGTGPATPTSPDGRFSVQATRNGTSRVWTLRITPTTGTGSPLDVTTASWGGAGGSNLAGIAFCPASPTLSALVLSDIDESDPPIAHQQGVTYRLKVVRLDGATPQAGGSLEGLKYLSGVQPSLGFSQDCSIVGSWSIDPTVSSTRNVGFLNIFTNASTTWSNTDPATVPSASLATIVGATINLTGPQGQNATRPVP
jgi:hypothetical protein